MDTTLSRGAAAESRAVEMLVRSGYCIVERNVRCKRGEIDVVARDGGVLVFVEVRSRADREHGHALEMVGRRKQRQVSQLAQRYIADRRPEFEQARFDVVAVTGDDIVLVRDAWRL